MYEAFVEFEKSLGGLVVQGCLSLRETLNLFSYDATLLKDMYIIGARSFSQSSIIFIDKGDYTMRVDQDSFASPEDVALPFDGNRHKYFHCWQHEAS